MTYKKNKYIKHVLLLIILTSCATASKDPQNQTFQAQIPKEERVLEQILEYKKFFDGDLYVIQESVSYTHLTLPTKRIV